MMNGSPITCVHKHTSLLLFLAASNIIRSLHMSGTVAESGSLDLGGVPVDATQRYAYKRTGA